MTSKHIAVLKKAYKKEKDAKVVKRILMVIHCFQGKTLRDVGERLQCDHKLVLYWKRRYDEEGFEGLQTRPRSGKPKLLSQKQEEEIKKKLKEQEHIWTTKKVQNMIKKETKINYTMRHITRLLHKWNFSLVVPRPTFWQRASGEEIKRFWKKNPILQEKIS